jgi:hypothetical protein
MRREDGVEAVFDLVDAIFDNACALTVGSFGSG